ncbi:MAG: 2OG-Fe(II) oxygenase [Natronospirillum sp.]|uniref:2OG-Fe(II) oxygenase n=1 Tax=Natronospirillum sp. TaxID=2812955 RepID=UPI0025D04F14|nr:2OG-Fe(II) oxygenase [Natronospirillum sp.]MCH8552816.1 2OG-Fe(II) oxygenase [Natronospirillum sp.]
MMPAHVIADPIGQPDALSPAADPFARIVDAIATQGFAICPGFLPMDQTLTLLQHCQALQAEDELHSAGIGRGQDFHTNRFVRQDRIHWLEGTAPAETHFLNPMAELQTRLNRELFIGLFDYEAHFALYPEGAFYKKHVDAFQGRSNRRLSTVLYLNPDWQPADGGELRLYDPGDPEQVLIDVTPQAGTLVVFESECFWHEVLPAKRKRYSIAGWFRVNASTGWRVDPPA